MLEARKKYIFVAEGGIDSGTDKVKQNSYNALVERECSKIFHCFPRQVLQKFNLEHMRTKLGAHLSTLAEQPLLLWLSTKK